MKACDAIRALVIRQPGAFMTDQSTDSRREDPDQAVAQDTGRFDTGEELEPAKDSEQTGRFDTSEAVAG
jgi:hypothetical protein